MVVALAEGYDGTCTSYQLLYLLRWFGVTIHGGVKSFIVCGVYIYFRKFCLWYQSSQTPEQPGFFESSLLVGQWIFKLVTICWAGVISSQAITRGLFFCLVLFLSSQPAIFCGRAQQCPHGYCLWCLGDYVVLKIKPGLPHTKNALQTFEPLSSCFNFIQFGYQSGITSGLCPAQFLGLAFDMRLLYAVHALQPIELCLQSSV